MAVLLCELCGSTLKAKGDGTYVCLSCGTEQIPDKQTKNTIDNSFGSGVRLYVAIDAIANAEYKKAFKLLNQILEGSDNALKENLLSRKEEIKDCCSGNMAQAISLLMNEMTSSSIDYFFNSLAETMNLLESIDAEEKCRLLSSVVLVMQKDLIDEVSNYQGIKLNEYGFNKIRTIALAVQIIINRMQAYDISSSDFIGYYQIAIEALNILKNNNSQNLVRDKWGAYKYVPRLDCEELKSLNDKIMLYEGKLKEEFQ